MIARFFNWLFSRRVIVSEDYMIRWHLTPEREGRRNYFLHKMNGPDLGRDMHDHPWDFTTFILWGGYNESIRLANGAPTWTQVPWLSRRTRKAEYTHAIKRLHKRPTWTLVITGPRRREWGFYTKDGWVDWRTYVH